MNEYEEYYKTMALIFVLMIWMPFFEAIDQNQLRFHYVFIKALGLVLTIYIIKFIMIDQGN